MPRTNKDHLKSAGEFHFPLYVLYPAYYNLFWPHSGMGGKIPAVVLDIMLIGPDKWLTTIRHAALSGIRCRVAQRPVSRGQYRRLHTVLIAILRSLHGPAADRLGGLSVWPCNL